MQECTAADIPHLGILQDAIHDVIENLHKQIITDMPGAPKPIIQKERADMQQRWQKVHAVLMTWPLIMQWVIYHHLQHG